MNTHFLRIVVTAAAVYGLTFAAGKAAFTAYTHIKEHIMCLDPALEGPRTIEPESVDSTDLLTDAMARLDEARQYLDLHSSMVRARIAELGVELPPFSMNAPVLVELRKSLVRAAPVLGLEIRL